MKLHMLLLYTSGCCIVRLQSSRMASQSRCNWFGTCWPCNNETSCIHMLISIITWFMHTYKCTFIFSVFAIVNNYKYELPQLSYILSNWLIFYLISFYYIWLLCLSFSIWKNKANLNRCFYFSISVKGTNLNWCIDIFRCILL